MDYEFILTLWLNDDNTFQVYRELQRPVWITNSIWKMDHDLSGNCYCKFGRW